MNTSHADAILIEKSVKVVVPCTKTPVNIPTIVGTAGKYRQFDPTNELLITVGWSKKILLLFF